jgi:hypothetical protein
MGKTAVPTEFIMPSWGNGAPELTITLVGKWEQTRNKGPDFDVHWFASKSLGGSLGIYVGHHPQPIQTTAETSRTNLVIGDKEVAFAIAPIKGGQKVAAIINDFFKGLPGPGVAQLKLHVMINVAKQDFLESVRQGLKTLKPRTIPSKEPGSNL